MVQLIKVGLILAVVAAIVYFVIMPSGGNEPSPQGEPMRKEVININVIEDDIKFLSEMSDSTFASRKNFYDEVKDSIRRYHKDNRLNSDPSLNNRLKDELMNRLYFAYIDVFIQHALAVFDSTECKNEELLRPIRGECKTPEKSELVRKGDERYKGFEKIQAFLKEYDEVNKFIKYCKSAKFPMPDFEDKNSERKEYLTRPVVKRDTCLKNELEGIPQVLLNKQFESLYKDLNDKIRRSLGKYPGYDSQREYKSQLYDPLRAEIDSFGDAIEASDFIEPSLLSRWQKKYEEISEIWDNDTVNANEHFLFRRR